MHSWSKPTLQLLMSYCNIHYDSHSWRSRGPKKAIRCKFQTDIGSVAATGGVGCVGLCCGTRKGCRWKTIRLPGSVADVIATGRSWWVPDAVTIGCVAFLGGVNRFSQECMLSDMRWSAACLVSITTPWCLLMHVYISTMTEWIELIWTVHGLGSYADCLPMLAVSFLFFVYCASVKLCSPPVLSSDW